MKVKDKHWEETMDDDEIQFIWCQFKQIIESNKDFTCCDNFRAARVWKSSQKRRFFKQRDNGCCGFYDTVVKRFNFKKFKFDLYLIGFNYGH